MTDDEYLAIGRQFGLFFRRAERFHHSIHLDVAGRPLERAAYGLLSRIASGGPERLSALAVDICVDLSTVSRQVAALEAAGLVRRTPDPSDRRASLIEATETGAEVYAQNRSKWLGALRELLADWTSTERQEFARLFARLNEAMERGAAGSRTTEHRATGNRTTATKVAANRPDVNRPDVNRPDVNRPDEHHDGQNEEDKATERL